MIELRHLRYFIAVAEELNFRRAAERIHIDQTPLSRTVRDLEDRLGLQLFVRGPRRLELTPAGSRLLTEARDVFSGIDRAVRAVRETDARIRAPLRIGIADGIAQPKLSECFVRWRSSQPEVPLELVELRSSELASALEREEVDAGFSFGLPDHQTIAQEPAWSYPVVALLPAGHELASMTELSMTDLLVFPLLSCRPDRQPGLRQQMRDIVKRYTEAPTLAGEASTLSGYLTRIASGFAIGLADAGHVATLRRPDIVSLPIREPERIITFVLHKPNRAATPAALKLFVTLAKAL